MCGSCCVDCTKRGYKNCAECTNDNKFILVITAEQLKNLCETKKTA